MDQPGLDAGLHHQALRGLRAINRVSGTARVFWRAIRRSITESTAGCKPLRLLDLACGGGDVALGLSRLAGRDGIDVRITGCDISPRAIEFAARQAEIVGTTNVNFIVHDVLRDELPTGHDVVTCSLFLHHLDEREAVELLRRAAGAAGRLLLVNDLRRSPAGWALAWLACRLLTRSPVVHADGPMSIAAAFTLPEAAELARQAGLRPITIVRRWPQRYLLTWSRA